MLHTIRASSPRQAQFLDLPVIRQQTIRDFLIFLGVNRRPRPYHVMNHLLKYSEAGQTPPNGVYGWLNDNATATELSKLKGTACLWIEEEKRYRFPAELYWQTHPFGRFRVQLSHQLRSLQNLLRELGVRDQARSHRRHRSLERRISGHWKSGS